MKLHNIIIFSSIIGLFMTGLAQAVEVNIETGKNISGKTIQSNSVNEGKVVINGKVIHGATRKMTKKEQKKFTKELNKEMNDMESEMEGMFD